MRSLAGSAARLHAVGWARVLEGPTVRLWYVLGVLGTALAVSSCAQNAQHQTTTFLNSYAESDPTPANFRECHGFACTNVSYASLSNEQWAHVAAVYKPPAKNAAAERRQIAKSIMLMQQ